MDKPPYDKDGELKVLDLLTKFGMCHECGMTGEHYHVTRDWIFMVSRAMYDGNHMLPPANELFANPEKPDWLTHRARQRVKYSWNVMECQKCYRQFISDPKGIHVIFCPYCTNPYIDFLFTAYMGEQDLRMYVDERELLEEEKKKDGRLIDKAPVPGFLCTACGVAWPQTLKSTCVCGSERAWTAIVINCKKCMGLKMIRQSTGKFGMCPKCGK